MDEFEKKLSDNYEILMQLEVKYFEDKHDNFSLQKFN